MVSLLLTLRVACNSFIINRAKMVFETARVLSCSSHTIVPEKTFQRNDENCNKNYEETIKTLNSLQTNSMTLQKSIINTHTLQSPHLVETSKFLKRIGISAEDLDKLNVIHVAGTKGKGSTCALVESILKRQGVQTGFYTSPHLTSVTERIRINGESIEKDEFIQYFWKIYNLLDQYKEHEHDMPPYFKFLTILSLHIFLEKNIDCAILEVGIGGEYDCTNIVRNTKTVGITSLALEHMSLLGNTLEKIAWQKAGIIKQSSNVYTVMQPPGCIEVIKQRAEEKSANLHVVPQFDSYNWKEAPPRLDIDGKAQQLNASLALQLSFDWMRNNPTKVRNKNLLKIISEESTIPAEIVSGLEDCIWPGRCQLIQMGNKRIFIDGAHTIESLHVCLEWFEKFTKSLSEPSFLIFNSTGDRNSTAMLKILNNHTKFKEVFFTPNVTSLSKNIQDNSNLISPDTEQYTKCLQNVNAWKDLTRRNGDADPSKTNAKAFNCIMSIFRYLDDNYSGKQIDVLVTGSLHLVGATLVAIEKISPDTTSKKLI